MIDALEDTLLVLLMGERFAHFTVGSFVPLHSKHTDYTPIVRRLSYRWGLDCSMVGKSDFTNFILPPAHKIAVAVTDSLNYHLDNARGKTTLQALLPPLATAGVNVTTHQAQAGRHRLPTVRTEPEL
jgi:hypothetical protein